MNEIGSEIAKLADENGLIQPEAVVAVARQKDNPLHGYFTWDDRVAAVKCRLLEARALIRSVVIESAGAEKVKIRAFVSLPGDRVGGEGYRKMSDVMDSDFLRRQLLADVDRQVESWRSRAQTLHMYLDADIKLKQA
jgi:hypothetical protein